MRKNKYDCQMHSKYVYYCIAQSLLASCCYFQILYTTSSFLHQILHWQHSIIIVDLASCLVFCIGSWLLSLCLLLHCGLVVSFSIVHGSLCVSLHFLWDFFFQVSDMWLFHQCTCDFLYLVHVCILGFMCLLFQLSLLFT